MGRLINVNYQLRDPPPFQTPLPLPLRPFLLHSIDSYPLYSNIIRVSRVVVKSGYIISYFFLCKLLFSFFFFLEDILKERRGM